MIDGGFDPVPVPASAGDTVDIAAEVAGAPDTSFSYAVPGRLKPVVVRTSPSSGKRDVPLNTAIVIVFSEPIDATTLTPSSVRLFHGSSPVAGSASLLLGSATGVVFEPSALLDANTDYRLVVTTAIHDLTGDALGASVTVEFTTGTGTVQPAIFVRVLPETAAVAIGTEVQLSAVARDTGGTPVIGRPVIWSSNDPVVGTVSTPGLVTALAEAEHRSEPKWTEAVEQRSSSLQPR